jgi:hypothetical protein
MLSAIWSSHIDVSYDAGLLEYDGVTGWPVPTVFKVTKCLHVHGQTECENHSSWTTRPLMMKALSLRHRKPLTQWHSITILTARVHPTIIPLTVILRLYAFLQICQKCPWMGRHDYTAHVNINCTYRFNRQSSTEVKHFIVQLMHKNYKILRLLKYLKLQKLLQHVLVHVKPSSGSHIQCLDKITYLVPMCVSLLILAVSDTVGTLLHGAQQVKICRHNTDNINNDTHIGTRYVILAKHWM